MCMESNHCVWHQNNNSSVKLKTNSKPKNFAVCFIIRYTYYTLPTILFMRTTSQYFSDLLAEKNNTEAIHLLLQKGLYETQALLKLSLKGSIDTDWMVALKRVQHTGNNDLFEQALLQALAVKTPWSVRAEFIEWLAQTVDTKTYIEHSPLHHAAFHGCHEAFKTFESLHEEKTGTPFNWNATNSNGHTPLYLSLMEAHIETTVEIIRKGGKATQMIDNPKHSSSGQKKISVLDLVYQNKSSMLAYIKEVWDVARQKASIEQAIEKATPVKAEKTKKPRKI